MERTARTAKASVAAITTRRATHNLECVFATKDGEVSTAQNRAQQAFTV